MPVPVALAVAAVAFQIGSSLWSFFSGSKAARERKKAAAADARDVLVRGEEDVVFYNNRFRQLVGQQRTTLAGQGLALNSGSAADIAVDTARAGETDVAMIRKNAQRVAASVARQGRYDAAAIQSQAFGAGAQAIGTLLGAAADPYDRWMGRRRQEKAAVQAGQNAWSWF